VRRPLVDGGAGEGRLRPRLHARQPAHPARRPPDRRPRTEYVILEDFNFTRSSLYPG
jgi:hypothetical protein